MIKGLQGADGTLVVDRLLLFVFCFCMVLSLISTSRLVSSKDTQDRKSVFEQNDMEQVNAFALHSTEDSVDSASSRYFSTPGERLRVSKSGEHRGVLQLSNSNPIRTSLISFIRTAIRVMP